MADQCAGVVQLFETQQTPSTSSVESSKFRRALSFLLLGLRFAVLWSTSLLLALVSELFHRANVLLRVFPVLYSNSVSETGNTWMGGDGKEMGSPYRTFSVPYPSFLVGDPWVFVE